MHYFKPHQTRERSKGTEETARKKRRREKRNKPIIRLDKIERLITRSSYSLEFNSRLALIQNVVSSTHVTYYYRFETC